MANLTPDERLNRLLKSGYLPRELPPPFVSSDFAAQADVIRNRWAQDGLSAPKTWPDIFSHPRHGRSSRRKLAIVNPVSHFYLASVIANEWEEIASFLSSSPISKFQPSFANSDRITFEPLHFEEVEEHKNIILSRYNKVLVSDISRFYPTLYTHVIAWAMHGKDWCKSSQHTPVFKNSLGNRLDRLVRKGQDNQSVGIPIGPQTSRVIAEIVGVQIDKLVAQNVALDADRAYRYVDDLCIGVDDGQSVDTLIAELSRALSSFELEINIDKTREIDVRGDVQTDWTIELRHFDLPTGTKSQRKGPDFYFKKAIHLGALHKDQNVLDYAVKKSMAFTVDAENWSLYEAYVLRCMRANSTTIEGACRILVDGFRRKRSMGIKWIGKFINDTIKERAPLGQHGEVAWSLFLAREIGVKIELAAASLLYEMESGVCALLTLDLHQRGLLEGNIDVSRWIAACGADGLRSSMWLVAYEAPRKGWLALNNLDYISADPYFTVLHELGVTFYDPKQSVLPVRKRKPGFIWPPVDFFGYS